MLNLKKLNLCLLFATILALTPTIRIVLAQSANPFYISGGVYPNPATYTIWKDGSYYFAKDAYGAMPNWGDGSTNVSYVIQTALDVKNGSTVVCLEGTYVYSTPITISGEHKTLRFLDGAKIVFTGSDSAIILNGDYNTFQFDEMSSMGASANYAIKDQGARWNRVIGNLIGTVLESNASRFKDSAIFFDADNARLPYSGGNLYDIGMINHGSVGIRLNSATDVHYEGNKFVIRVIMRSNTYGLKIGSDSSIDTVMFNSFYGDIDAQGITDTLIAFYNDKNFVVLEHWNTAMGSYEVSFNTNAHNNTLIHGAGATNIRINDPSGYNIIIPEV